MALDDLRGYSWALLSCRRELKSREFFVSAVNVLRWEETFQRAAVPEAGGPEPGKASGPCHDHLLQKQPSLGATLL